MREKIAEDHFRGKNGHKRSTCSVSIAEAFKDKFPLTDEERKSLENCGHGMAPGGVCGALFAARLLAWKKYSHALPEIEKEFLEQGGSITCKEIRTARKMSCTACVRAVARHLEKI